jgi:hypothetical protein
MDTTCAFNIQCSFFSHTLTATRISKDLTNFKEFREDIDWLANETELGSALRRCCNLLFNYVIAPIIAGVEIEGVTDLKRGLNSIFYNRIEDTINCNISLYDYVQAMIKYHEDMQAKQNENLVGVGKDNEAFEYDAFVKTVPDPRIRDLDDKDDGDNDDDDSSDDNNSSENNDDK